MDRVHLQDTDGTGNLRTLPCNTPLLLRLPSYHLAAKPFLHSMTILWLARTCPRSRYSFNITDFIPTARTTELYPYMIYIYPKRQLSCPRLRAAGCQDFRLGTFRPIFTVMGRAPWDITPDTSGGERPNISTVHTNPNTA